MRRERILVDTGPIVAVLSDTDQHHERCVDQLALLPPPLLTCWPVITEAQWLLRKDVSAIDRLFAAFESGLLRILPIDETGMPWLQSFLRRYHNLQPDLADASLVYLAEREKIATVFTLDNRDFSIYRCSGNRRLKVIPTLSR